MNKFAQLDQQFVWHPFTQMRNWLRSKPIVIAGGQGAVLRDVRGQSYLDANSSIWTNLHGHNHPKLNAAVRRQLKRIAHSSALGLANEPASLLAGTLVEAANTIYDSGFTIYDTKGKSARKSEIGNRKLATVFYSDDGSTALEVALKLAYEFTRRTRSKSAERAARPAPRRSPRAAPPKFLSLEGAYHGDTVGAVALGHIDLFHRSYSGLLFQTDKVMAPYCYRCPFNRARPERADAREYRRCHWECLGQVEQKFSAQKKRGNPYAAFVFEPLVQGAAGIIPQPPGWLRQTAGIARAHGALLIADEVMTGFGRTGVAAPVKTRIDRNHNPRIHMRGHEAIQFACHHEGVQPDFLCLAKGLTGGYLPMAATLTTRNIFAAFLGNYGDFKTFFHGHSYTGNQLGAAAALASLDLLQSRESIRLRQALERSLHEELAALWALPNVGDIRQIGLIAGIELVKDWRTREPFDLRERAGIRVCEAMARRGVLTRPIGNVIVLMPPYCTTRPQLNRMVTVLRDSVKNVLGN